MGIAQPSTQRAQRPQRTTGIGERQRQTARRFTAEDAESAEKDKDRGKGDGETARPSPQRPQRAALSRSTMLTALSPSPLDHAPRREPLGRTRGDPECVEGSKGEVEGQRTTGIGERQRQTARRFTAEDAESAEKDKDRGKGDGETARPSPQRSRRPALSERSKSKGRRGGAGTIADCPSRASGP